MSRTHIRHIDLASWFPKDDPVAVCIARLCILREDLYLEFEGLNPENIKLLDENSAVWRRTYFLVTSTLLEQVESENELAFVLGHELGHFHNRDHLRSLGRGLIFGLVLMAIGSGGGSGEELIGFAGEVAGRNFSRLQERDADAFGLELVHAEYGHVDATWDFFDRLPRPDGLLEKQMATYHATHPLNDERVTELKSLAHERGWATEGDLSPLWE